MSYSKYLDLAVLRGKTITSILGLDSDVVEICTSDGKKYGIYHQQDCCESVGIHDVSGNPQSLIGSPLTVAREEASCDWPDEIPKGGDYSERWSDSFTWTHHFLETETTKVRIRWLGTSNGYYSETVQMEEVP